MVLRPMQKSYGITLKMFKITTRCNLLKLRMLKDLALALLLFFRSISGEMSFFEPPVNQEIEQQSEISVADDSQCTSVKSMDRQSSHTSRSDVNGIRKSPKNSSSVACTTTESTARHLSRSSGADGIQKNATAKKSVPITKAKGSLSMPTRVISATVSSNEESMDSVRQKSDKRTRALHRYLQKFQRNNIDHHMHRFWHIWAPNSQMSQLNNYRHWSNKS